MDLDVLDVYASSMAVHVFIDELDVHYEHDDSFAAATGVCFDDQLVRAVSVPEYLLSTSSRASEKGASDRDLSRCARIGH